MALKLQKMSLDTILHQLKVQRAKKSMQYGDSSSSEVLNDIEIREGFKEKVVLDPPKIQSKGMSSKRVKGLDRKKTNKGKDITHQRQHQQQKIYDIFLTC